MSNAPADKINPMILAFPHDDDDDRLWMNPLLNSIDWDAITRPSFDLYKSPVFDDFAASIANTYKPWAGILDTINVNPLRESMSAMFETTNVLNNINIDPLRASSAALLGTVNGLDHIGVSTQLADLWPSISASVSTDILAGIDVSAHAPALNAFSSVLSQVTAGVKIAELTGIIGQNFTMPDSVMKALGAKLDFFQPQSFTTAVSLGLATPGVEDAVTDYIEEHPEEVEEFVSNFSLADIAALFEAPASEYVRVLAPGAGSMFGIGTAFATGATGSAMVFVVFAAIVMAAFPAVEEMMRASESRRQIEG